MSRIEELVPRDELEKAVATAVESIKTMTQGKNVAYAWSGGKDSIVLSSICRLAGVNECMFAHTDLEYPAFLEWCLKNKPEDCEVVHIPYGLDWLAEHENMLFPKGRELQKWYKIVQRAAFTKYFFDHKLDMMIVGHRKADGNIVGPDGTIRKGSGEIRYSPLADWSHEMILAYITKRGKLIKTHLLGIILKYSRQRGGYQLRRFSRCGQLFVRYLFIGMLSE